MLIVLVVREASFKMDISAMMSIKILFAAWDGPTLSRLAVIGLGRGDSSSESMSGLMYLIGSIVVT